MFSLHYSSKSIVSFDIHFIAYYFCFISLEFSAVRSLCSHPNY